MLVCYCYYLFIIIYIIIIIIVFILFRIIKSRFIVIVAFDETTSRQLDDEAGHNTGEGYYPGKYLIHAVRNVREQVVRRRSSHMDAATQEAAHSSRSPGYPGNSHRSARKGHKGRHPAVSEDGAELTAFCSTPPPNAHGLDQSNLDTTYELSRPSVSRSRSQTNMHKRLVFRIIAQEGIPSGRKESFLSSLY